MRHEEELAEKQARDMLKSVGFSEERIEYCSVTSVKHCDSLPDFLRRSGEPRLADIAAGGRVESNAEMPRNHHSDHGMHKIAARHEDKSKLKGIIKSASYHGLSEAALGSDCRGNRDHNTLERCSRSTGIRKSASHDSLSHAQWTYSLANMGGVEQTREGMRRFASDGELHKRCIKFSLDTKQDSNS